MKRYSTLQRIKAQSKESPKNLKNPPRKSSPSRRPSSVNTKGGLLFQKTLDTYLKTKKPKNKIVVYTAITNDYDRLMLHSQLSPNFDYVVFSNTPQNSYGVYAIRKFPYENHNPVKTIRYVKTHPHILFPGYETSIWIDANIIIRGDLNKHIVRMQQARKVLAAIPHPHRKCTYEEGKACIELEKDKESRIEPQMEKYKKEGFPSGYGLVETGFLIANLKSLELQNLFNIWWKEIEAHSHRDQLSVMYALKKAKLSPHLLMKHPQSVRDHLDFVYYQHGKKSAYDFDALKRLKVKK